MLLLTLLLAPTLPPVTVGGQAGQVVTLTVRLPDASTGILLNREAPNTMTLKTPWATTQVTPSGRPFQPPRPEFADYYGTVDPTTLKLRVPAGVKPGRHHGTLTLQLFTCDRQERLCKQRNLTYPMSIQVGSNVRPGGTLHVRPDDLRRRTRLQRPDSQP